MAELLDRALTGFEEAITLGGEIIRGGQRENELSDPDL